MTASSDILAEIENLHLTARQVAHGSLAGMHRSLRRGHAIEFSAHQLYTPGDDIRHIDWRAYGKTDRLHIKQFEDETNLRLEILIDHSASMAFGAKLDYARTLAAALSYLALRQGDSVGLLTFSESIDQHLPPRATSSHLQEILRVLTLLKAHGKTAITTCLEQFAASPIRRSVVIVISDLFDPHPNLHHAFARLCARKHDVAVMHVLHPYELDLNYESPSQFVSLEDTRELFVHPRVIRSSYNREIEKFLSTTRDSLLAAGVDYHFVNTNQSAVYTLGLFLRGRENRPMLR